MVTGLQWLLICNFKHVTNIFQGKIEHDNFNMLNISCEIISDEEKRSLACLVRLVLFGEN